MARKEDVAKLAEELMNQRENIRNIGIVAHIDHGKCVSGDTKIALADGRFVRAAELYEEYGKSGKLVKSSAAEKVFDISGSGLKVFSLNKKEMIQEKKKVSHAWKMKEKGELVELELSTGMRIETTPEHKYLVLNEDGKIKEVKAAELRENAFIVCPKKLEHNSLSIDAFKQSALERLGKDNSFFVVLEKGRGIELKKKILENGMAKTREAIGSALGKRGFACAVYANRYRIQDYLRLAELFGISNAYDAIEKINYRQGVRKEGHSSLYLKLPSNDYEITELMYLLGVIWGDGGISGKEVRVTNESRQMQQEIKRIVAELFGREVRIKKYGGRATRIDLKLGRTFTELLIRVFGLPRKNKSHSIGIPELVQKMPKEHLKAFIQGYFDTDGTLETSRRAVSISSASRQMMGELQLNLLKFGCPATFNRKKQALYISASNMETFREKINFRLESKRKRLDAIVEKAEAPNRNTDLLPLKPAILKGLRESMGLAQGDFFPSYGPIERGQIPLYSPHLDEAVNVFYRNAGNPKIKDMNAWTEMQELEKIGRECYYPQITAIKRKKFTGWVYDFTVQGNHNFIGNGCVVHNTTMTDSLVAASGLISKELAGQQLFMDSYALEQERGITINAATISLVHEHKGVKHLINVIDTPGHIDFGGDVIRAMRAVDGVIVVVDAVEGTMPQTETVIRQALKEHVKPVLFINKVDRLVNELQVTEEEMQQRFVKAIAGVNNLIKKNVPKEFVDKWVVKVEDGSVVFGSGYYKWAVSVPRMKETEVSFKDVYRFCKEEKQKELAEKSPLHLAILQMVIDHLPNPITAQRYRTPAIWSGDKESEVGKAMLACDQNGPFAMMVTDVSVDPHAGDIASGRVYSGTVRAGMTVRALGLQKEVKLQQVGIFMGPDRVTVDAIPAGNIAALVGLKEVFAGETISTDEMKEFESFMS
ncbi:GTP-binding protein, partial [Candidatus Micrarchaeota archaeon]|nr:GTP-binding protein [Candidatus Micrarchaeota archaeon]